MGITPSLGTIGGLAGETEAIRPAVEPGPASSES
jgi:hypothetical protein